MYYVVIILPRLTQMKKCKFILKNLWILKNVYRYWAILYVTNIYTNYSLINLRLGLWVNILWTRFSHLILFCFEKYITIIVRTCKIGNHISYKPMWISRNCLISCWFTATINCMHRLIAINSFIILRNQIR